MPVYEWQYNGVAPMVDIVVWCWEMLESKDFSYRGLETIHFHNEAAYTLFLVRWS
jgi:hypothetical protein